MFPAQITGAGAGCQPAIRCNLLEKLSLTAAAPAHTLSRYG